MNREDARAALALDEIDFEEAVESSGEPRFDLRCGEWLGTVRFEAQIPDLEWRIAKIQFVAEFEGEDAAITAEADAWSTLGEPNWAPRRHLETDLSRTEFQPWKETARGERRVCPAPSLEPRAWKGPNFSYAVKLDRRNSLVSVIYAKPNRVPSPGRDSFKETE